jgi:hypothetical protein
VEEIGEHQPMLDILLEAIPELQNRKSSPKSAELLTDQLQDLMDDWNDLTSAINDRLSIALQLQSLLVLLAEQQPFKHDSPADGVSNCDMQNSVKALQKTCQAVRFFYLESQ